MLHEVDPKEALLKQIGDSYKKFDIFNTQVLMAVYIRPEKTKGGIMLANKTRDEDRYQSKVGLILKKGPSAFVDDEGKWFNGLTISEGDWLVFRPSDGWSLTINGVLCRMLDDTSTRMRIQHPDDVY
jgi:co-chaperonin GroES (HSP10)